MRPHSLLRRLLVQLITAQVGLIMVALAVFPFVSPYVNYADIADRTVRKLLTASLCREVDGSLRICPSPEFQRYARRRTALAYAAMTRTDLRPFKGSQPDLAFTLRSLGHLVPHDNDTLETDRPGSPNDAIIVTGEPTPFGSIIMATSGNVFGYEDLIDLVDDFMPALLPIFAPLVFGTVVVVPMVVRRSMRPLRLAANEARQIGVRSLDQRLPEAGMPIELLPLVSAVNEALTRLEDQVKRQRLFLANAAHELRTPVAILQARVDALQHDHPAQGDLLRDVGRVRLLVEQMLLAARLGERGVTADEVVELIGLVRNVVATCAPLAIRGGHKIALETSSDNVTIRGNARAIEGAVTNLIDNALRAAPKKSLVTVAVHANATIEVRDHGPGVAKADQPHVFEPFWRKDNHGPGTGLGLSIVREVAQLHGGVASVEETPGGGATFRLRLSKISTPHDPKPGSGHVRAM